MSIAIVQGKPAKSHKGEIYPQRIWNAKLRHGETVDCQDRTYDELTPEQHNSIWFGDGCGHPSNRPKTVAEAKRWIWTIRLDNNEIHGFNPGWSFAL